MKVSVFQISYYLRLGADGPVQMQPPLNVAGETQGDAITLLSKQYGEGIVVEVTGIRNGEQEVLVADAAPADNAALDAANAQVAELTAKLTELQTVLDKVKAADEAAAKQSPAVPHS